MLKKMKLLRKIKNVLKVILEKRQPRIIVQANVVQLAPNELLSGRTILITGGTSGIGNAIARKCVESGATIVITSRNKQRAEEAAKKLQVECNASDKIYGVSLDLEEEQTNSNFVQEINNRFHIKIDSLINNAGIANSDSGGEYANFNDVMNCNLRGTYFLSIAFAEYLKSVNMTGHILNIASSSSFRPAITPYMLSKWGIRGLTLGLAKKYIRYGIVINGLAPGPTATPMLNRSIDDISNPESPIGRLAVPDEIASMAVVLMSNIGNSIVGDIVCMTGGAGIITFDDVQY